MKRVCSAFLTVLLLCALLPMRANAVDGDNPVPKAKQGVVSILSGVTYASNGEIVDVDEKAGQGTGFGVGLAGEPARTFVTNCHVVSAGDRICEKVHLLIDGADIYDGKTLIECTVVYADSEVDLAVIQADAPVTGVSTLPLLPSEDMETGNNVFALGFPGIADEAADSNHYTTEDITVTNGIISRYLTSGGVKCMAHTAAVNHGNSGGPLINDAGQVIGINSFIYYNNEEPDLRNYAIYIDYAMSALDELGIEYIDASQPVQKEDEASNDTNYVVIIAVVAGVVLLAVVLFVMLRRKKKEDMIILLATGGPLKASPLEGKIWEMAENRTYHVGRDPSCDIVYPLNAKGVSRNHCTVHLYRKDGKRYLEVRDSGATYGTFLNGRKLTANSEEMVPIDDDSVMLGIGSYENNLFIKKIPACNVEQINTDWLRKETNKLR